MARIVEPIARGEHLTTLALSEPGTGIHLYLPRTTLARTCTIAHTGSCSAQLGRARSGGDAILDDAPQTVSSTVAGATYAATAWVRAPSGRTVRLRLREWSGGSVLRTSTATASGAGSWRQVAVTSTPTAAGSSLSVEVVVSLAKGTSAQVDDVSLKHN